MNRLAQKLKIWVFASTKSSKVFIGNGSRGNSVRFSQFDAIIYSTSTYG